MSWTRRSFLRRGAATALAPFAMRNFGEELHSNITNRWGHANTTKLHPEEVCVFEGTVGAAYNHHPQILSHRGKLYASWSDGLVSEDNPGQRMLLSISRDEGKTWSTESTITPPPIEKTSTYTAMGIRSHGSQLVAYYGHYGYTDLVLDNHGQILRRFDPNVFRDPTKWIHRDSFTAIRVSSDGGVSWDTPRRILERFVPNLRPFPVRFGRLIMPGNVTFPYTDDPSGTHGWKHAGIPRLPNWSVDDPEGFHKACYFRGDPRDYCESSFFQTDDGVIHMLMRTTPRPGEKHNDYLAVTESADNGKTWSEPAMTTYTDNGCRFQFGRLPDGRFFGLSCASPKGPRTPLVLAVSRDGIVFDRHYIIGDVSGVSARIPGGDKDNGAYGYPSCDISNGKMYVTFSRCKEDIYFLKLDLDQLV